MPYDDPKDDPMLTTAPTQSCGRAVLHSAHVWKIDGFTIDGGRRLCSGYTPRGYQRDPWAVDVPYQDLRAALAAIAADAAAREDHHTAAMAHAALAGEQMPDNAEDRAPRVYLGPDSTENIHVSSIGPNGLLLLRQDGPRG